MTARIVLAILLMAGACGPAMAHAPIKGIGTFYNGLLHPVLVPAHLLVLAAVGLLIGQHAPRVSRLALPAFAAALTVTLTLIDASPRALQQWPLLAIALVAGLAVALARAGSLVATALALGAGVAVALDSAPDGAPDEQVWLALSGTGLGAALVVTYVGGFAARLELAWQKTAIRAAGSWIAASALLVLTLDLFPTASPPA